MCDTVTLSIIDSVVDSKVVNGESFTAFDVSKCVQADLKSNGHFVHAMHRHQAIKNDVHRSVDRYLADGKYERNLRDVGNNRVAYLYSPVVNPVVSTLDSDASAQVVSSDAGAVAGVDARGSVCVPANLVRSIGLSPGDAAVVYLSGAGTPHLVIAKQAPVGTSVNVYTVDAYYNIRLTQNALDKIGDASKSNLYAFVLEPSSIIVKDADADE